MTARTQGPEGRAAAAALLRAWLDVARDRKATPDDMFLAAMEALNIAQHGDMQLNGVEPGRGMRVASITTLVESSAFELALGAARKDVRFGFALSLAMRLLGNLHSQRDVTRGLLMAAVMMSTPDGTLDRARVDAIDHMALDLWADMRARPGNYGMKGQKNADQGQG